MPALARPASAPSAMTLADFMAWEEQQEGLHEFVDGEVRLVGRDPLSMFGATVGHSIIVTNLCATLRTQLRPRGCLAFHEGIKLRAGDNIFCPEGRRERQAGLVAATRAVTDPYHVRVHAGAEHVCERFPSSATLLERPLLIAEVLSPSTERYDRGRKFARYREFLPSLQVYLLVSQSEPRIEVHCRTPGGWSATSHTAGTVALAQPPCELALADVYADVFDLSPG